MANEQHSRTEPDCLTCWKRETCDRAEPGTFCTSWQSKPPQPKGKDPNQAWREGDEPPL